MANRLTRFFTRFSRTRVKPGTSNALSPIPRTAGWDVSPQNASQAAKLRARRDFVNATREAAASRAAKLPSARPGFTGMTVMEADREAGDQRANVTRVRFSERRLSEDSTITELENWQPLSSGSRSAAIDSGGEQLRRQLLALATSIEGAFPVNHPTRELRALIGKLDSQAIFILEATGFWNRLKEAIGDAQTGEIDTKNLHSSLAANQTAGSPGSIIWGSITEEMKNARAYNVRSMGRL